MPAIKKTPKTSSSGADSKSKARVKNKMQEVMHEFKEGKLRSSNSTKKVKNPKQAIAIGLSEARRVGANIPPPPTKKKAVKRTTVPTRKAASKKPVKKARKK